MERVLVILVCAAVFAGAPVTVMGLTPGSCFTPARAASSCDPSAVRFDPSFYVGYLSYDDPVEFELTSAGPFLRDTVGIRQEIRVSGLYLAASGTLAVRDRFGLAVGASYLAPSNRDSLEVATANNLLEGRREWNSKTQWWSFDVLAYIAGYGPMGVGEQAPWDGAVRRDTWTVGGKISYEFTNPL